MNKLLLTSICAAALSASASAFTLDLAQLNGQNIGSGNIVMPGIGTFTVTGPGTTLVSGGVATLNNAQSFTVFYPSNVSYVGALIGSNINVNDSGTQVQYTATANGATAQSLTFNQVPEPSSTALLGLGGIALILRRRK